MSPHGRFDDDADEGLLAEINMTPLVDVMLVLVVIFIITAPLLASSIRLDLPKTDAASASESPKFITGFGSVFSSLRPTSSGRCANTIHNRLGKLRLAMNESNSAASSPSHWSRVAWDTNMRCSAMAARLHHT